MAVQALTNPKIWFGQYHLSSDHHTVTLTTGFEEQDNTVFGNTARSTMGTLPMASLTGAGFMNLGSGNVHEALRGNLNVADIPVTLSPDGGDDGEYAETFLARILTYTCLGQVGTIAPFTWSAKTQGQPSLEGTILGVGAKSTTANGTARQLGAVAAGQRLYCALHILTVTGTSPTLDLVIASDDDSGFASGTSRITFAQKIAAGYDWQTVDGAVTDDWWRAQWTIGGSDSPSFDVVIVAGIF